MEKEKAIILIPESKRGLEKLTGIIKTKLEDKKIDYNTIYVCDTETVKVMYKNITYTAETINLI
jgi:hypothetical protein